MPTTSPRTTKKTAPPAGDAPVIVTFDGHQYKIPPSDDWPSDALELLFEGNLPAAMKLIVGESVYAQFNRRHPKLGDLKKFMEKVGEVGGAGN